jgi:hypothetical protein
MKKFIDSDKEHIQVLAELGQLDDMEDWELYKQQEEKFEQDIDIETWAKYLKTFL